MEKWAALIDDYADALDWKHCCKTLETATNVLKKDLASFEIEWILETIFGEPVNLIKTLSDQRNNEHWNKAIRDGFQFIATVVGKFDEARPFYDDIIQLCDRSPVTEASINCLSAVARKTSLSVNIVNKYIKKLETVASNASTTCKAPLIALVGVICEYHPETVSNSQQIWRYFISILINQKASDKVVNHSILAMAGLLKNFGDDLPTNEMQYYYNVLKNILHKNSSSQKTNKAIISLIQLHCSLFKEKLQTDKETRLFIWNMQEKDALIAIYKECCKVTSKDLMQAILTEEILPRTNKRDTMRYTALTISKYIHEYYYMEFEVNVDVYGLEFELRTDKVDYDVAEAISWCISAGLPNSVALLQAAILFHDNLPSNKRKETVANNIINAPSDLRRTAIKYLIQLCCESESNLDKYLPLWTDIFTEHDSQITELSNQAMDIFDSFLDMTEESNLSTEQFEAIFSIWARLLSYCDIDKDRYRTLNISELPIKLRALLMPSERVVKTIQIARCSDEVSLCDSCLVIIEADEGDPNNILQALQIVLSRNDVEPKTLLRALNKLENMILSKPELLYSSPVLNIMNLVKKLKPRIDIKDREGRVLNKEVVTFLGKYSSGLDIIGPDVDNSMIVKLKDGLALSILNPIDGLTYKLNLKRILALALSYEDVDTLNKLMIILCANLSTRKDPTQQLALTSVIHALCRCHVQASNVDTASVQQAFYFCDNVICIHELLMYIKTEKSPGVRKMLADGLEALLVSERSEQLVTAVVSAAQIMMGDRHDSVSGLQLIYTIMSALKCHNNLAASLLPDIVTTTASTHEIETHKSLDLSLETFMDRYELFEDDVVIKTVGTLMEICLGVRTTDCDMNNNMNINIYKSKLNSCVQFMEKYAKKSDETQFLNIYKDISKNAFLPKHLMFLTYDLIKNKITDEEIIEVAKLVFEQNNFDIFYLDAILNFLRGYSEALHTLKYRKTMEYIAKLITKIQPEYVIQKYKELKLCIEKYKNDLVKTSLRDWCENLPLKEITMNIEKDNFTTEHNIIANSLKLMLNIMEFDINLSTETGKWTNIIQKIFAKDVKYILKNNINYLNDLLFVSLKFKSNDEVNRLILEGRNNKMSNENVGMEFCRFFIKGFCTRLLKSPYLFVDDNVELLNDLVKCLVVNPTSSDEVLNMVDELWPIYERNTNFNQKHSLLIDLMGYRKSLNSESKPLQWVMRTIDAKVNIDDVIKLISVVPSDDGFSETLKSFAVSFPVRLSEFKGSHASALRAMIESLAQTGNRTLLDIIKIKASAEEQSGWWDEALDSCMATLSQRQDTEICRIIYEYCWEGECLGVTSRMLVPLLRYSPSSFCERFFCAVLEELLNKLMHGKKPSMHYEYRKSLVDYTRVLIILQVAFDKINKNSIEMPESVLYSEINIQQAWYLVSETCKRTVNLSKKMILPPEANERLKEIWRVFQCAVHNCLSIALRCRSPDKPALYDIVFNTQLWSYIVDTNKTYKLPLKNPWIQRTVHHKVSQVNQPQYITSPSYSVSSRKFLRSMSEDRFVSDFLPADEKPEVFKEDVHLSESELNHHECAASITSMLQHCVKLTNKNWLDAITRELTSNAHINVKYLLAQVVCNCKEELAIHANVLAPALLGMLENDIKPNANSINFLNGLRVEILQTIIKWSMEIDKDMTVIIHSIVLTLHNQNNKHIYKNLQVLLENVLDISKNINLDVGSWPIFVKHMDPNADIEAFLDTMLLIIRKGVKIPILLEKIEHEFQFRNHNEVMKHSSVLGALLNISDEEINSFYDILNVKYNSNILQYINIVYYAQKEYGRFCDRNIFSKVSTKINKTESRIKKMCLNIIANYISNYNDSSFEHIYDALEIINIQELLNSEHRVEAMGVVAAGLKLGLKDRVQWKDIVIQVSEFVGHTDVNIRRAALKVMVEAFKGLFPPDCGEPSLKRQKTDRTMLLTLAQDVYTKTVYWSIGHGAMDIDDETAGLLHNVIEEKLCKHDLAVRFTECFYLLINIPLTYTPSTINSKRYVNTFCTSVLIDMLLKHLRKQDMFVNNKLMYEPLFVRDAPTGASSSRMLSLSSTYQGSFSRRRKLTYRPDMNNSIDAQITIDSILETFIQFAKNTTTVGETLSLELLKCIRKMTSLNTNLLCEMAMEVLTSDAGDITPFIIEMCRMFADDCYRYRDEITEKHRVYKGTEGQDIITLLYEELTIRDKRSIYSPISYQDIEMSDDKTFSVEALQRAFGVLSDWDNMPLQMQRVVVDQLPPLWTDNNVFLQAIRNEPIDDMWFKRMVDAYKHTNKQDTYKWMREIDRWPRDHFAVSSTVEALSWQCNDISIQHLAAWPCSQDQCLAKRAARLMIRSSYIDTLDTESDSNILGKLRSHNLIWCKNAIEKGLYKDALECLKMALKQIGNTDDLDESLPWFCQKLLALQQLRSMENDADKLTEVLCTARSYAPEIYESSEPSVCFELNKVILSLIEDIREQPNQIELQEIVSQTKAHITNNMKQQDVKAISFIYEHALYNYEVLFDGAADDATKTNILRDMLQILNGLQNASQYQAYLCFILNKIKHCSLDEDTLEIIRRIFETNPDVLTQQQIEYFSTCPPLLKLIGNRKTSSFNLKLQLICDPGHLLMHYCKVLLHSLCNNDTEQYEKSYNLMKNKIFENPYAGSDYILLSKYKNALYDIQNETDKGKSTLKSIITDLEIKTENVSNLKLSQLCPSLSRMESEGDRSLSSLLALPQGVTVVKFFDQIEVIDTKRRPTIFRVLLSNGRIVKYLHKSGEDLRADAAAQAVLKCCAQVWGWHAGGYHVTPLSDDCGIIEYLEDHVTLTGLLSTFNIEEALSRVQRAADDQLILSPATAAQQYQLLCDLLPSYSLRSAIEQHSASTQDFITKKRKFIDTLSAMTIINWILGLGDRHPDNTLYSTHNGSVCTIDWGEIFKYGEFELPPARLTPNIIAVCGKDFIALEARLQKLLGSLRESSKLVLPFIKASFNWMGPKFDEKFAYITNILQGKTTSHKITIDVLQKSKRYNKEKYIDLLNEVFKNYEDRDNYSVENQIEILLKHCTDTRILSVTRTGWVPWF